MRSPKRCRLDQPASSRPVARRRRRCWSRSTGPRPWRCDGGCPRTRPAAEGRLVLPAGAAEGLGDFQHGHVVLTGPVVGLRWGEPEDRGAPARTRAGPALGGELLVGAVQALGGGHHRRVQEQQGQRTLVHQGQDGLERQPGGGPGVQQPGSPHLSGTHPRRLRRRARAAISRRTNPSAHFAARRPPGWRTTPQHPTPCVGYSLVFPEPSPPIPLRSPSSPNRPKGLQSCPPSGLTNARARLATSSTLASSADRLSTPVRHNG